MCFDAILLFWFWVLFWGFVFCCLMFGLTCFGVRVVVVLAVCVLFVLLGVFGCGLMFVYCCTYGGVLYCCLMSAVWVLVVCWALCCFAFEGWYYLWWLC